MVVVVPESPTRRTNFSQIARRISALMAASMPASRHTSRKCWTRSERLPLRLLREGLEQLGDELEKRVFPFEGLLLAIFRGGFDNEQRAVLAAYPLDT